MRWSTTTPMSQSTTIQGRAHSGAKCAIRTGPIKVWGPKFYIVFYVYQLGWMAISACLGAGSRESTGLLPPGLLAWLPARSIPWLNSLRLQFLIDRLSPDPYAARQPPTNTRVTEQIN